MNKISNKILLVLAVTFILMLAGCLKDKFYDDNFFGTKNSQNQNFVEIHLTSQDNSNLVARSFESSNSDTTVTKLIPVNLTSGAASSDVTVSVKMLTDTSLYVMDSLVNKLNYKIPDPSIVKLANSGNVTIPKGSSTGYVGIVFKPSDLTLGITYILGIKLTGVSDPKYTISNLDTGFVTMVIKNKWDGTYHATGVFDHPTAGPRNMDMVLNLVTIDATTVQCQIGDLGGWNMNIQIDPVTNEIVSLTNVSNSSTLYFNTAADNIRGIPGGDSHYDPATHTFYLYYYYNTGAPRVITEVLTLNN
jgi:hypothetical protein